MDRRKFINSTLTAMFATLLSTGTGKRGHAAPGEPGAAEAADPPEVAPAPRPEITAAVDALVPADPEIPGDFKGSDYGADQVVAASLGEVGQVAVTFSLNQYGQQVAGKNFLDCSVEQRLEAIKQWLRDKEGQAPILRDMLTGLITLSMIGTYEENSPEKQRELFTSMGWFDPADPTGTFRLPNEGYPDSYQFPVRLKKGLREEGD